jgi:hypothetical protein
LEPKLRHKLAIDSPRPKIKRRIIFPLLIYYVYCCDTYIKKAEVPRLWGFILDCKTKGLPIFKIALTLSKCKQMGNTTPFSYNFLKSLSNAISSL